MSATRSYGKATDMTREIDPKRHSKEFAQEIMEDFYPEPGVRFFVSSVLARAIIEANRADRSKWSVTLHYRKDLGIRVNVGMLEVLILTRDRVYLVLSDKDFSVPKLVTLPSVERALYRTSGDLYQNAPSSISCWTIAYDLPEIFSQLQASWISIIKLASHSQRQPATNIYTHSPGITQYLQREFTKLYIPSPSWFTMRHSVE